MKRSIAVFLIFLFTFSISKIDVQAASTFYYDNQIIKVGLDSMSNTALTVVVNGDFKLNDSIINNGTRYILTFSNGKIRANNGTGDVDYDSLVFEPQTSSAYITMTSVISNVTTTRNYKGTMTFKILNNEIMPINRLNIEEYLKGVIGFEMGNSYPLEALKSQAVVARTYAAIKISVVKEYDVVDTVTNQVYRGFNNTWLNVNKAVEDTRGQFVTYGGYLIKEALYSANHGGYTEDAVNVWGNSYSYLKSKKDDFDDYTKYSNSASYDWTKTITKAWLAGKLGTSDINSVNINLSSITTYVSGRISNLSIEYRDSNGVQQGPKVIKDNEARTFFGVNSAMYTISYDSSTGNYIFTGHGSGHGLGMSQIGAKNRALAGQTYDQIIGFYYDGAVIKKYSAYLGNVTASSSGAVTGEQISVNAQGLGGSENYLYKYVVERDGQIVQIRDYSSSGSLLLQPDMVGNYKVNIYFKDSLSKEEYEEAKSLTLNVTGLADANLDKKVNIQDLVLISKNLKTTKAASTSWNTKLDLVRDDEINILDLAKAAQNYNKEY
jgi:stage II sporulation protein D